LSELREFSLWRYVTVAFFPDRRGVRYRPMWLRKLYRNCACNVVRFVVLFVHILDEPCIYEKQRTRDSVLGYSTDRTWIHYVT